MSELSDYSTPARRAPQRLKRDGTPDLRFGPRPVIRLLPRSAPFTLADLAVADAHIADLEAAGARCRFVADGGVDVLEVQTLSAHMTVRRRGTRIFVDHDDDARDECGARDADAAFHEVRVFARIGPASYARAAKAVATVMASLPDWLL